MRIKGPNPSAPSQSPISLTLSRRRLHPTRAAAAPSIPPHHGALHSNLPWPPSIRPTLGLSRSGPSEWQIQAAAQSRRRISWRGRPAGSISFDLDSEADLAGEAGTVCGARANDWLLAVGGRACRALHAAGERTWLQVPKVCHLRLLEARAPPRHPSRVHAGRLRSAPRALVSWNHLLIAGGASFVEAGRGGN